MKKKLILLLSLAAFGMQLNAMTHSYLFSQFTEKNSGSNQSAKSDSPILPGAMHYYVGSKAALGVSENLVNALKINKITASTSVKEIKNYSVASIVANSLVLLCNLAIQVKTKTIDVTSLKNVATILNSIRILRNASNIAKINGSMTPEEKQKVKNAMLALTGIAVVNGAYELHRDYNNFLALKEAYDVQKNIKGIDNRYSEKVANFGHTQAENVNFFLSSLSSMAPIASSAAIPFGEFLLYEKFYNKASE